MMGINVTDNQRNVKRKVEESDRLAIVSGRTCRKNRFGHLPRPFPMDRHRKKSVSLVDRSAVKLTAPGAIH